MYREEGEGEGERERGERDQKEGREGERRSERELQMVHLFCGCFLYRPMKAFRLAVALGVALSTDAVRIGKENPRPHPIHPHPTQFLHRKSLVVTFETFGFA